jgi:hypothetical protein
MWLDIPALPDMNICPMAFSCPGRHSYVERSVKVRALTRSFLLFVRLLLVTSACFESAALYDEDISQSR